MHEAVRELILSPNSERAGDQMVAECKRLIELMPREKNTEYVKIMMVIEYRR